MTNPSDPQRLEAGLYGSSLAPQHLDQLIATNRSLHAAVIQLQDLLLGRSLNTALPTLKTIALESEKHGTAVSVVAEQDGWGTSAQSNVVEKIERPVYKAVTLSRKDFEQDNEHARCRHEQRRQTEIQRLKSRVSYKYVSFPSTFYQPEIDSYDRTRLYSAADPHHWWHRLHHRTDKKLSQGPHASLASTGQSRDELLDALFDFESMWPEQLLHTLPFRELEHTYGYKLHRVKAHSLGAEAPSSELLIVVGRFFSDLADAMAHPDDSSTAADVKRQFTFGALYRRCLDQGVLGPLEGPPEKRTKTAYARIYRVLRALNHVADLPEDLPQPNPTEEDPFVLDKLDQLYIRDAAPELTKSTQLEDELHFAPKELCFKTLTELGGLKIVWTNLFTQHLRLIRSSKTLLLFWDVSILGQSPLFAHWPQWMNHEAAAIDNDLSSYATVSAGLLEELQRSYRVIFGNPDGRFLDRFFKKHFRSSGDEIGIILHDLESVMMGSQRTRVNISRSSARQALKYYLRARIPASILALRPELDRKKHKGPRQRFNWHHWNFRGRTSGKLMDLLNAGPPYPLDFWMHISYLLELSQSSNLSEMERYAAYPIFGDRLRELKVYMDKQRPKNLKQLFKDRRDTVGYWAFWAVFAVGGISILLALVSIAVSTAQMVAGFQALQPLRQGVTASNGSASVGRRGIVI